MRKLLKSKKALSPVVAAIILIAVTVAVSIAVAAWMGSLTIGFMETSEITITDMTFTHDAATPPVAVSIDLDVSNTGTSAVTISIVKVNGATISTDITKTEHVTGDPVHDFTFDAGLSGTITITKAWTAGSKYSVSLFATDGTLVSSYTATA